MDEPGKIEGKDGNEVNAGRRKDSKTVDEGARDTCVRAQGRGEQRAGSVRGWRVVSGCDP